MAAALADANSHNSMSQDKYLTPPWRIERGLRRDDFPAKQRFPQRRHFLLGLVLFSIGLHHLHDPWVKRSAEMVMLAHGVETKARVTHAEITPEGDTAKRT